MSSTSSAPSTPRSQRAWSEDSFQSSESTLVGTPNTDVSVTFLDDLPAPPADVVSSWVERLRARPTNHQQTGWNEDEETGSQIDNDSMDFSNSSSFEPSAATPGMTAIFDQALQETNVLKAQLMGAQLDILRNDVLQSFHPDKPMAAPGGPQYEPAYPLSLDLAPVQTLIDAPAIPSPRPSSRRRRSASDDGADSARPPRRTRTTAADAACIQTDHNVKASPSAASEPCSSHSSMSITHYLSPVACGVLLAVPVATTAAHHCMRYYFPSKTSMFPIPTLCIHNHVEIVVAQATTAAQVSDGPSTFSKAVGWLKFGAEHAGHIGDALSFLRDLGGVRGA